MLWQLANKGTLCLKKDLNIEVEMLLQFGFVCGNVMMQSLHKTVTQYHETLSPKENKLKLMIRENKHLQKAHFGLQELFTRSCMYFT